MDFKNVGIEKLTVQRVWSRFSLLVVVVTSAAYILWIKCTLGSSDSIRNVTLASVLLLILLAINIRILNTTKHQSNSFIFNKNESWRNQALAVAVVIILFIVNSLRYYDIMPIVLVGESNLVLERANLLLSYWVISPSLFFENITIPATYNWGLSPIYFLFMSLLGDAQSTVKIFTVLFWAAILTVFLWAFVRWYNLPSIAILCLTPAVISAAALGSIRAYKWHIMAALASSSIYFLIKQLQFNDYGKNKKCAITFGLFLLSLSIFLYHGVIIYIPIMLAIMAINGLYKRQNYNYKMLVIVASLLIAAIIFLLKMNALTFLVTRFKDVFLNNAEGTTLFSNLYSFFSLFLVHGSGWTTSTLFLLGLTAGFARWTSDIVARTTLAGFFIVLFLLFPSYGLSNLDENCYIIIFFIGIICLGIKELFSIIALYVVPNYRVVMAFILSIAFLVLESQHFYLINLKDSNLTYSKNTFAYFGKAHPYENNLGMFLLADIKNRKNIVAYFPDKILSSHEGGFNDDEFYDFPESQAVMKDVKTFTSIHKLKQEIIAHLSNTPETPVIVYYHWHTDLGQKLGSFPDGMILKNIVVPYPDVWVTGEKLSYLAVYNAVYQSDVESSSSFSNSDGPHESMINRVRRLARIIRGNNDLNFF